MSNRKTVLAALSACIVGFLATMSPLAASATSASSATFNYGSYAGHNYSNSAAVLVNGSAYANTYVTSRTGGCALPGYIGNRARLFNSAGTLVADSGISYNSTCVTTSSIYTPTTSVRGNYYSRGQSSAWTGTSYITNDTFTTPSSTF